MEKKDNEQQTMEEYLLSQLDTPVILKDGSTATKADGSPMTKQAQKVKFVATDVTADPTDGDDGENTNQGGTNQGGGTTGGEIEGG